MTFVGGLADNCFRSGDGEEKEEEDERVCVCGGREEGGSHDVGDVSMVCCHRAAWVFWCSRTQSTYDLNGGGI